MSNFPLVTEDDNGIRPAGNPDECYYCRSKVGEEHKHDCVTVSKRVRVRYSFDVEIDVPYSWDADSIEFQRNESSWCARNAITELQEMFPADDKSECPCSIFHCELLETTDDIPRTTPRERQEEAL